MAFQSHLAGRIHHVHNVSLQGQLATCRPLPGFQRQIKSRPHAIRIGMRKLEIRAGAQDGSGPASAGPAAPQSPPASHPIPVDAMPADAQQLIDEASSAGPTGKVGGHRGSADAVDEFAPTISLSSSAQTSQAVAEPTQPLAARVLNAVPGGQVGRLSVIAIASFAGLSVVVAVVRGLLKFRSPKAQKIRNINKNKAVVDTLSQYLPQNRQGLGKGQVRGLRMKTGFSGTEIFRKYLWYLLRERPFDPDAVADMQQLKSALQLSDDEVAEALKERAQRIYKEYGNVMLDVEGMSKAGIARKSTCRALFSKLLYLAESDELLPSADIEKRRSLVQDVFGATESDASKLRIVSLYEVDQDRIEQLAMEPDSDSESGSPPPPGGLSADVDE